MEQSHSESESESECNFEVEAIVDHKTKNGKNFFLIKWKGWKESQNTWEPQSSLNCPAILEKYRQSSKIEPRSQLKYTKLEDDIKGQSVSQKRKVMTAFAAEEVESIVDTESEYDTDGHVLSQKKFKQASAVVAEEVDYEVEDIVNHKIISGEKLFLVKWKGYSSKHNTWQAESSLSCRAIVNKYLKSSKVQKTTTKQVEFDLEETSQSKGKDTKSLRNKPKDWEVEKITGVKCNDDDTKEFLIRWKGCDASQDTWEPEYNVDCTALLNKFITKLYMETASIN